MLVRASEVAAPIGMDTPAEQSFPPPKRRWRPAALLLGATAYLTFNLFRFCRAPFLLGGDQIFFWMVAQRMLDGQKIYRDFFQYTPPGTDLAYLAVFRLFGPHLWVTNAVVFALGLALCWICFSAAREMMDHSSAALAAALFLVFIFGKLLSGTHYMFSALAIMCAVKLMMRPVSPPKSLVVGMLLGLASFFTQSHGAIGLLGMLLAFAWEAISVRHLAASRLRSSALLLVGYSATLLLFSAHWIASEGLSRLWRFQVTYLHNYLNLGGGTGFLGLPALQGQHVALKLSQYIAVYLMVATVYPLTFWRCWRERQNPHLSLKPPVILSSVGTLLLLTIASNPNWLRVYTASMPAVILFVWLLNTGQVKHRAVLGTMWAVVGCLAISQTVGRYRVQNTILRLPAGAAAVDPLAREKLEWLMQRSTPGDYFFQAAWPGFYLPLELRNPVYVESIEPVDRLSPTDIASIISSLDQKQIIYILWPQRLDSRGPLPDGSPDILQPLRTYIHHHYTSAKVFADGDIVFRRKNARGNQAQNPPDVRAASSASKASKAEVKAPAPRGSAGPDHEHEN